MSDFQNSNIKKGKKILIVGGVAGGASAAARLRRLDEQAQIIIFERGAYVSFANCGLPYYISGVIPKRESLLIHTPQSLKSRYNLDIRVNQAVKTINRKNQTVEIIDIENNKTYTENYDYLILAPGAEPMKPPIPGINSPRVVTLRTIPDTDNIKKIVTNTKPKHSVVVGGGFIGLEMAENLHHIGINVTIIEMLDQVMGPVDYEMASYIHQHLKLHGLELILKNAVKEFQQIGEKVLVKLNSGKVIETDLVIFSIGVKPETELARSAGLEVNRGIITNQRQQTSDPNIYALGDATEVKDFITGDSTMVPLAGPANRQGRIIADQICGRHGTTYKGTQGTAIVKVFNIVAAATGLNEKILKQKKIPYKIMTNHFNSHAMYYPGAQKLAIKILYSPNSGKILGGQIIGGNEGVDKRIDVLATAIRNNNTVYDLQDYELAYAPPFNTAKDSSNYLGFMGVNDIKGDVNFVQWDQVEQLQKEGAVFLDVREKWEYDIATIPGALLLPLDSMRQNLNKVPKDKKVIIFCQVGLRGYIAYRLLANCGFKNIYNLSGGFRTWNFVTLNQQNEGIFSQQGNIQKPTQSEIDKSLSSFYCYWHQDFKKLSPIQENSKL